MMSERAEQLGRRSKVLGVAIPAGVAYDPVADWMSPAWWLMLPVGLMAALFAVYQIAPQFYAVWIGSEGFGLIELSHVAMNVVAAVVAVRILFLPAIRSRPVLIAWVAVAGLSSVYVAGEEVSWGQHFLNWQTPEAWLSVNDQGETNLHNTTSWLDQKPRVILELGVIIGGIILPLVALWRPALRSGRFAIVIPPFICLPTAVLAELVRLPERLGESSGTDYGIFYRSSEMQEMFFFIFTLMYLIVLRRRLKSR